MQINLLIACADESAGAATATSMEQESEGIHISCAVTCPAQAAAVSATQHPDVLLLDFETPQRTMQILAQVSTACPATRPLLLCGGCSQGQMVEFIRHGNQGCVPRGSSAALISKAVRAVHQGDTWYGRRALLEALRLQVETLETPPDSKDSKLTRREDEILRLIGTGLTNKEIGRHLKISDNTVKTHLHRVYTKLNQSGRFKAFLAQPNGFQSSRPGPV